MVPAAEPSWPVRAGAMPPLAEGFTARPETMPALAAALVPGAVVALVPGQGAGSQGWLGSCGKTQLAVGAARSLWHAGSLDLLAWIGAGSRAAVLAGYLEAAAALRPLLPDSVLGDVLDSRDASAESAAVRLLGWLAGTTRP